MKNNVVIAISGTAGSGKDTVGRLLAKRLKLRTIKSTMKSYAKGKGIDVLEFEKKYAMNSSKYDKEMDAWQKEQVRKGNCVLVSMLSALNASKADLKVFLHCSEDVRADRVARRDGIPKSKALKYVRDRDNTFRNRVKRLYHVDFWNPYLYDLRIDTGKYNPQRCVDIIVRELEKG